MRKIHLKALIIFIFCMSFVLSGVDINSLREKYIGDSAVMSLEAWRDVNKKLISGNNYTKSDASTFAEFRNGYDKVKKDLTVEIQKRTDISEDKKKALIKLIGNFTDEKYKAVLRAYQSTPDAWADFAKKSDALNAELKKSETDMKKANTDLSKCADSTLDSVCTYARKMIKDRDPLKIGWELGEISKISADAEKMKLDARDRIQSTGFFYSPDMKKLIILYQDRIIDSFRDTSVFILRDAIAVRNAMKGNASLLTTAELSAKYKFPTDFVGLYLGDTKDNTLKLFKNSKLLSHKAADASNWADTYIYEGNPQMKKVSTTVLYFARDILVKAELYFNVPKGTDINSLFDEVRALLESKYGVFALIYSRDSDPDETIKYRQLTPKEMKEDPKRRDCVKYIWEGAADTSKMQGSARGNMVVKIRETTDNKILVIADHETLLLKVREKFNLKKDTSAIGSF
ncbi:MAG: hypothetical protein A2017_01150 [Lentisphaerae bacterium GWF2_44_16]|nr:MAG: hypothetical protein A2017_01150 [Lentisphaerae bacterium GWF2_44_16]